MTAFHEHLTEQLEAMEDCLAKRRVLACLCLLYTAIDVVASLERKPTEGTKAAFVRWVDENMLKFHPLPCTALELYGARCGVLHTFTPSSDLSRAGKARAIAYAWGSASAEDLREAGRRLGRSEIAVHITDLVASFRGGLSSYLDAVGLSRHRTLNIERRASLWFAQMGTEPVRQFLHLPRRSEQNGRESN